MKIKILVFALIASFLQIYAQNVMTIAGSKEGYVDSIKTDSKFYTPTSIVANKKGELFIADSKNHRIRKMDLSGKVITFVGSTEGDSDGYRESAKFSYPHSLVIDNQDNIYVSDSKNNCIRRISPEGLVITLAGRFRGFKDDDGIRAEFSNPTGLFFDKKNEVIYVADRYNNRIRKVNLKGNVKTVAGRYMGNAVGNKERAMFYHPTGVVMGKDGNLYVTDYGNNQIKKVSLNGDVSLVAGFKSGYQDGDGKMAQFLKPHSIALDNNGDFYITDSYNNRIRKMNSNGEVHTFAGNATEGKKDGRLSAANFYRPIGIAFDQNGNMLLTESSHVIRRIEMTKPILVTSKLAAN